MEGTDGRMHYRNGFNDRNNERRMIEKRITRLLREVDKYSYDDELIPGGFMFSECDLPYGGLAQAEWTEMPNGSLWGKPNGCAWFRQSFVVPPEMTGKQVVYRVRQGVKGNWFYWGGPQILAYVNGKPAAAMDANHREIVLSESANAGDSYTVELSAFFDRYGFKGAVDMDMCVCAVNPLVRRLYYDLLVPLDVSMNLDDEDIRRLDTLKHLNAALSLVDFRYPAGEVFNASVKRAIDYLEDEFYGKLCGHEDTTVSVVGNTHIDVAWLWTLAQTRKKTARSYSTVLHLMKRYPEYTFIGSQAQLYQYLKEDQPELYAEVVERVKSGGWEAEGAMWVEPDTNIPSGESLIRQFLYGKRFFREEFGYDSKLMWLPDVFGYSGALPQIMRKCGVDYFMTTKISWNEFNKLPYDSFIWRGIDGSEVLTHFVGAMDNRKAHPKEYRTVYEGYLNSDLVIGTWKRYQQKDINRDVLFCYGYGDGGGGPEPAMLENAKRLERGIPGAPRVKHVKALDYFKKLESDVQGKRLPVWSGELYFEHHRGTYTSIAKNKRNNRQCEQLLHDAEFLAAMNSVLNRADYPKAELDNAWKLLLTNQFHDILPGSSIREVYEDSDLQYAEIRRIAEGVINANLQALAKPLPGGNALVVFNPGAFEADSIVEFATERENFGLIDGGHYMPVEKVGSGRYAFKAQGVPAYGCKTFTYCEKQAAGENLASVNGLCFESDIFIIRLNESGEITSLYNKEHRREYAIGEPMNRLIAFEDMPAIFDAWNIDSYFDEKSWHIGEKADISVIENNNTRCVIRVKKNFMSSEITQDIVLVRGVDRIDVRNMIDWKEKHILLKAEFPFPVNAPRASFDIQFGNVERTTHENTSWDFAQFEVCAHKWADLSENGFGLSILNDCKYGYEIKHGRICLSLLKSATDPNEAADRELHSFTYSIYPHLGAWKQAGTVRHGYLLNQRLYAFDTNANVAASGFVSCAAENNIIETVKRSEDGRGLVLRMYENMNKTSGAVVSIDRRFDVKKAYACNMLEEAGEELVVSENSVSLVFTPFEVKTILLTL